MSPSGHQRIFVSYRRGETSAHAGRIYDSMVARFGEDNVFMDVEMEPGVDFVDRITEVVSSCTVLIAVIGKSWADTPGADGQPRLHDEADFVRLEVGAAVQNSDVTVIPALVDGALMPRAEQLPEEMRHLARRNALELSDGRWRYDVGRLNDTLEQLLEGLTGLPVQPQPEAPTPPPEPLTPNPEEVDSPTLPLPPPGPPEEGSAQFRLVLEGVLVAAVAAFLGRLLADPIPSGTGDLGHVATIVLQRSVTWGLTAAAVGVWLALRTKRTDVARCGLLGLLTGLLAGAVGGAVFGLPVRLPDPNLGDAAKENWDAASLAVTGAFLGGLLGTLWRRPQLGVGLASGFAAGLLAQALINNRDWNERDMPGIGFVFSLRAALIVGITLAVLVALDLSRSSSPAREPAAR